MNFTINPGLAQPSGNKLGYLRTKIYDEDGLVQTMIVNSVMLLGFLAAAYGLLLTANERAQIWSKLKA